MTPFLEVIKSSVIVGSIAGIVRVLLHPSKHWKEKISIFVMSIFLASLVGIWIDDLQINLSYHSTIVGAVALLGKEILETLITYSPTFIKSYLKKFSEK